MSDLVSGRLKALETNLNDLVSDSEAAAKRHLDVLFHDKEECVLLHWKDKAGCWDRVGKVRGGPPPPKVSKIQYDVKIYFTASKKPPESWELGDPIWAKLPLNSYIVLVRYFVSGAPGQWGFFKAKYKFGSASACAKYVVERICKGSGSTCDTLPCKIFWAFIFSLLIILALMLLTVSLCTYSDKGLCKNVNSEREAMFGRMVDSFPILERVLLAPIVPQRSGNPSEAAITPPDLPSEPIEPIGNGGVEGPLIDEYDTVHSDRLDAMDQRNHVQDQRLDALESKPHGIDEPPCWPNAEGTQPEFIYDVWVSEAGIVVKQTYPLDRSTDYGALPVPADLPSGAMSSGEFRNRFEPLFEDSVTRQCRHSVRLYDNEAEEAPAYIANRAAVEGYFYIYRP